MMNDAKKVIFFDRDGTITFDAGYNYRAGDCRLLPGVVEGLKKLSEAGYEFIILTNQSGIGRGFYTENDYQKYTDCLLNNLNNEGVEILGVWYCPHHPDYALGNYKQNCDCRKPLSGMFKQAETACGPFDYQHSWSIGDSVRDAEAAKNQNMALRTILVPKNFGNSGSGGLDGSTCVDFSVKNFLEAVKLILAKIN